MKFLICCICNCPTHVAATPIKGLGFAHPLCYIEREESRERFIAMKLKVLKCPELPAKCA
jgi:hypothetical protein